MSRHVICDVCLTGGDIGGSVPRDPHGLVRRLQVAAGAEVLRGGRRVLHYFLVRLPQAGMPCIVDMNVFYLRGPFLGQRACA